MIVVNPSTRQFNIPGADLVFGVTADSGSEIKYFQCPRYVGNSLDIASCFVRINYRNGNGELDSYLVEDVTVDGDNVTFSWLLAPKVTAYKGQVKFVMCAVGPDLKVKWHTAQGTGQVHEGLEPDQSHVEDETADVVAQLVAMVEAQTVAVENTGETWVESVKSEGAAQVQAVKTAAEAAEAAAVAEIEAKGVNTRESIPADYTALSEAVDGLVSNCAGAIVCEAEGKVITLNDSSNLPMQGLRIFGRSTQDGTPAPDAPVEIVSVEAPTVTMCGKNIFDVSAITTNGSVVNNGDGTITVTKVVSQPSQKFAELCPGLCSGDVATFSFVSPATDGTNQFNYIYLVGAKESWKSGAAKTITQKMLDGPIYFYASKDGNGAGVATTISDIQVELGDTPTDYEPYSGQTVELTHILPGIPVTSGGNYTDSDGQQWICDEVDLERGVYVQRVAVEVCDGSADEKWWVYNGTNHEGYARDAVSMKNGAMQNGFCSRFPVHSAKVSEPGVWMGQGNNFIYLHNTKDVATDISAWLAWLSTNAMTLAYPLATPIETPLSETEIAAYRALHTNKPNTTILNDAGAHMAVAYAADTKLYIDNKIAALTAQV